MPPRRHHLATLLFTALACGHAAPDGDDDRAPPPAAHAAAPALDAGQQAAVGVVVAHPRPGRPRRTIAAYGQVLDPAALVADAGQLEAARADERAAAADLARLGGLYRGEAGASLKMLQAAQAEQARAQAQGAAAAAAFAQRWGPLAALAPAPRQQLIAAVAGGGRLLVRADLLGRRSLGELPQAAELDVDGVRVPARVLGALRTVGEVQGAGVLLEVAAAPPGFGAGARVPVVLAAGAESGLLVPASALIYDEHGAHVYRQLAEKGTRGELRYALTGVTLLQPQGADWLVGGLAQDALVVVDGAGVLWSLEGLGAGADHDED